MPVDLEALDAALGSTTLALLGDTITYTPFGGSPLTFKALVDYGDGDMVLGTSRTQKSEAAVEVAVAQVAQPKGADLIHLPKTGIDYRPISFHLDETGDNWLILLKKNPT